jgi:hypothetical protein
MQVVGQSVYKLGRNLILKMLIKRSSLYQSQFTVNKELIIELRLIQRRKINILPYSSASTFRAVPLCLISEIVIAP